MISESQQEQASLYALGLLDADEAAAFERQTSGNAELHEFVRDLQESVALLTLDDEAALADPPAAIRARVMADVRPEHISSPVPAKKKVLAFPGAWVPWTLAALFLGCSGTLLWLYQVQGEKVIAYAAQAKDYPVAPAVTTSEPLAQLMFCALEPTPDFAAAQPHAVVLWDAAHRQGKLRVNQLTPPAEGKDYQLWTVEAGKKQTVNAGVFHVGSDGTANVPFQPVSSDGQVVAVAISLERAGGSPTNQGPVLLLGKF